MARFFKKPKHYNGTGFDLGGVFSNSPAEVNIEGYVRDAVEKDDINDNPLSKPSFELQLRILFMQIELYKLGEKDETPEDNYCGLYKCLLIGIADVYRDICRLGYEKYMKEMTIKDRIKEIQDNLSSNNSKEGNIATSGKIVALANLEKGNLYYSWDLDDPVTPIKMNPDYIELAEGKYRQWLPGKIARDLGK